MKKILAILSLVIIGIVILKLVKAKEELLDKEVPKIETVDSIESSIQTQVSDSLELNLRLAGYITEYPKELILVAFKEEQNLQVYAKEVTGVKLIKEYPFTGFSGQLGPKLKQFDLQIPEGIYKIDFLNPYSSYHLSMKVSYPNEFDISKSKFSNIKDMGGDIFIHGKSSTVGCIPIGDEGIEELYLLTEKAMGNEVKVIISPRDFRVNPDYPEIDNINWEYELYDIIKAELIAL